MLKNKLIILLFYYNTINTKEKEDYEFLELELPHLQSLAETNWDNRIKEENIKLKDKIGSNIENEDNIYKSINKLQENKDRDWNSIVKQKKEEIENAKNRGFFGHSFQLVKKASYDFFYKTTFSEKLQSILAIGIISSFVGAIASLIYTPTTVPASKPKENIKKINPVTFANIGGYNDVKNQLKEIIKNDIKDTKKTKMTCIIFYGPPGTGKTFFAQAFADEANIYFKAINYTDILSKWYGESEQNLKRLFKEAKEDAPCVIFFDEIDTILGNRDNDYNHIFITNIKNLLLGIIDGTEDYPGVVFIGATNRLNSIDPAFLRPGRFEYQIPINLPEYEDRLDIITLFLEEFNLSLKNPLTIKYMAEKTNGLSPADINKLFRILKNLKTNDIINQQIFIEAYLQLIQGDKNEKIILSKEALFQKALYESGKALITYILEVNNKNYYNFDFVTITPRSKSTSTSHSINPSEYQCLTKDKALGLIDIALAGRAAQEIAGEIDAGGANDLKIASDMAKKIILEYGLNDKASISLLEYEYKDEIRNIINSEYKKVTNFLNIHKALLLNITQELLTKKTIFKDDIINLVEKYEKETKNTVKY
jgi:cell division protease FtsH